MHPLSPWFSHVHRLCTNKRNVGQIRLELRYRVYPFSSFQQKSAQTVTAVARLWVDAVRSGSSVFTSESGSQFSDGISSGSGSIRYKQTLDKPSFRTLIRIIVKCTTKQGSVRLWVLSEDSDQPAQMRTLIWVFAGRSLNSKWPKASFGGQRMYKISHKHRLIFAQRKWSKVQFPSVAIYFCEFEEAYLDSYPVF